MENVYDFYTKKKYNRSKDLTVVTIILDNKHNTYDCVSEITAEDMCEFLYDAYITFINAYNDGDL